jgi:transcriptional regulator with XRE-family HTH domain
LSQEALGYAAGLHRNYVGGIERGELNPALTNLAKIAEALDLRTSQLLALAEAETGGGDPTRVRTPVSRVKGSSFLAPARQLFKSALNPLLRPISSGA